MSIESARLFALKMKEDEAFRKSFMQTGDRKKALELAKAGGFDFTLDEIREVREEERTRLKEAGLLSDEDLAKVAAAAGCGGGATPFPEATGGEEGWCVMVGG